MARRKPRCPKEYMWGKEAKKKMIDLDLTTNELADAIGKSRKYVSSVLNGQIDTAQNTINLISDYLDIPNVYINDPECE